jgi:hypothetical protein
MITGKNIQEVITMPPAGRRSEFQHIASCKLTPSNSVFINTIKAVYTNFLQV